MKISKKIMKLHEFEDSIYYRAACSCGDERCDLTLELEKKQGSYIYLNMYKELYWSSHWISSDDNNNFLLNWWLRIKAATKILFTGYIKVEEVFIFKDKEQIDGFSNALKEGYDYLFQKNILQDQEELRYDNNLFKKVPNHDII